MMLLHVLSLFVFPELQSILDTLNVFRVCILRNLYRGNRRTIAEVVWSIRHDSIYHMWLSIVMDMAVLLLCLHSLIAFYIYIIFMNSIKVIRDASLINIVIIIVILIFAFWNHNLNVFDTIFVKSKLLRWLMSLKSILIGLYVGTSHF